MLRGNQHGGCEYDDLQNWRHMKTLYCLFIFHPIAKDSNTACFNCLYLLKGALDNFSLIPNFFFQKSWAFYTIRSGYLCSDCMLNLTWNFNLITKIYFFFFFAAAIFKILLLKMAATVMTVEFGTIHH